MFSRNPLNMLHETGELDCSPGKYAGLDPFNHPVSSACQENVGYLSGKPIPKGSFHRLRCHQGRSEMHGCLEIHGVSERQLKGTAHGFELGTVTDDGYFKAINAAVGE